MSSDIAGSETALTPSHGEGGTAEDTRDSQQESEHDLGLRVEENDMAANDGSDAKAPADSESPLTELDASAEPLLQVHVAESDTKVQPCESDDLPPLVAPSKSDDTVGLSVPASQEAPTRSQHLEMEHAQENDTSDDHAKVDGEEKSEKATKEEVSDGPQFTEESARINQQQQQQQQQPLAQRPRIQQHQPQTHRQQQQPQISPPRPVFSASTEIVHSLFGPRVGHCWGDFSCQYHHVRGRLYASTEAVLFYSNLFGFEKRVSLRYDNVLQMQLYRATSIQISVQSTKSNDETDENDDLPSVHYIFKGFSERAQTLQLLIDLWKHSQGPENIEAPEETDADIRGSAEQDLQLQLSEPELHAASPSKAPSVLEEGVVAAAAASQPSNMGPHNPSSILRPSKISTPPSRPVSPARIDTAATPTRLFPDLASSSDRGRRSKSMPPLHRRRNPIRSQSIGKSETTTNRTADRETFDWEKEPSQSDLDAWNAVKASADPCIKLVGIKPTELACSLGAFFKLFLADDASHSIDKYQRGEEVKDLDVKVTPWEPDSSAADPGALIRTISFRHPVSSSFGVGPSHAPTKKRQRLRRYPGCGICITNSTTVEGLPGADCFVVEDQWVIEVVRFDGNGATRINKPRLKFSAMFGANFSKFTFLKSIIQKNINAGNIEWFEGFTRVVVSAVKQQQDNVSDQETLVSDTPSKPEQVGLEGDRSMAGLFSQLPVRGGAVLLMAGVVCQIFLMLFLFVVVIGVRRSQQNSEAMLEDLKLLRLEHGKLLELLATGVKECAKLEVQTD